MVATTLKLSAASLISSLLHHHHFNTHVKDRRNLISDNQATVDQTNLTSTAGTEADWRVEADTLYLVAATLDKEDGATSFL